MAQDALICGGFGSSGVAAGGGTSKLGGRGAGVGVSGGMAGGTGSAGAGGGRTAGRIARADFSAGVSGVWFGPVGAESEITAQRSAKSANASVSQ